MTREEFNELQLRMKEARISRWERTKAEWKDDGWSDYDVIEGVPVSYEDLMR